MQSGDLNGDGYPDVVASFRGPSKPGLALFLHSGTNAQSYQPMTTVADVVSSTNVLRDFNGDGRLDIASSGWGDGPLPW